MDLQSHWESHSQCLAHRNHCLTIASSCCCYLDGKQSSSIVEVRVLNLLEQGRDVSTRHTRQSLCQRLALSPADEQYRWGTQPHAYEQILEASGPVGTATGVGAPGEPTPAAEAVE
eukprot:TRINITY_DN2194_c0_g1_i1.p1 TRINITY_DN2194_c0_g1~~TRINITY_DN2194_c0_g1_i1.p1  ORF type:complete len:116 (-),score=10.80 TRINITY_DN2194_c0_g1_i1:4-351(-)